MAEEDAIDYSAAGQYQVDGVLRHKKFGLGLIIRVEQQRVEVTFQDKVTRKLILTYTPPKEKPETKSKKR